MNKRQKLALAAAPLLAAGGIATAALVSAPAAQARFTCPSFALCFFQNSDYTGNTWTVTGPLNSWTSTPTCCRGSAHNTFTAKEVWMAGGGHEFCLHAGEREPLGAEKFFYYIRPGGDCNLIPPPPP